MNSYQLLHEAFKQNRLSHAYLLSGQPGLGKIACAKKFAAFLLCEGKKSEHACECCRGCQLFLSSNHPDFLFIEPHEKSHAIKIDQVRALSEKISQTAQRSGYRVVIISPADNLPMQAANALLKTLEEPVSQTVFFLIDHCQHPIVSTIKSRCQILPFSDRRKLQSIIAENIVLRDQLFLHLIGIKNKKNNPIALINDFLKYDINLVLQILLLIAVDISKLYYPVDAHYIVNHDIKQKLLDLSIGLTPQKINDWQNFVLEKKSYFFSGLNLNQQLCLESIFIEWERVIDNHQ